MAVTIYLARHGKTLFNAAHRAQGWCDAPLTREGVAAATQLGQRMQAAGISFDAAFSGDLGRQRATARLILAAAGQEDLPLTEHLGLRECSFGRWEGEKESDRDEAFRIFHGLEVGQSAYSLGRKGLCAAYVGTDDTGLAESYEQVCTRIHSTLLAIGAAAEQAGQNSVLAVSSGMITMTLLFDVLGVPHSDAPNGIPTASCTVLHYENGALQAIPPVGRLEF